MKRKMKLSLRLLVGILGVLGLVACKQEKHIEDAPCLYGGPPEDYREIEIGNDSIQ